MIMIMKKCVVLFFFFFLDVVQNITITVVVPDDLVGVLGVV